MKITELCNTSTAINTNMLLEYVEKKRNVAYVQHLIIMIKYVAFKTY